MFIPRHTLSALLDGLEDCRGQLVEQQKQIGEMRVELAKVDVVALERLHSQVLNAIRSLRRLQEAQDERSDPGPVSDPSQLTIVPSWAQGRK